MADAIDRVIDEVTVDAYGPDEQLSSFRQWFEDTAVLPFAAWVIGVPVEVTAIDYDGDDRRGLVAQCIRDHARHTVSLLDVTPSEAVSPPTLQLIDAYRRWMCVDPRPRSQPGPDGSETT